MMPTRGKSRKSLDETSPMTAGRTPGGLALRIRLPALVRSVPGEVYLLGGITVLLVMLGVVMVFSASSVEQQVLNGNPFSVGEKQATFAAAGVAVMLLVARIRRSFWVRIAPWALAGALLLQLLTALTPLGTEVGGNQNWINLGGVTVQPSEFLKIALVLAVAAFFARREPVTLQELSPVLLMGALSIAAIYAGKDMGTSIVVAIALFTGLFFAGIRLRLFVLPILLVSAGAFFAVTLRGSRSDRVAAWLSNCSSDPAGTCWQAVQGTWALAHGGIFGVGLGQSSSKWSWLPEASNDFIVAIIGEETGLIGLLTLLTLFVLLAFVLIRITGRTRDPFARVATAMILAWMIGQAFINIAVVLGLLPVLGVPLPFISAGGSSLVANLIAIGIVMSLARPRTDDSTDSAVPPSQ
ncbi:MAG: putative lipid II flippase FtsW [Microbacteriaceae bacterium]|nr:MAG: putative lipid II flippase FtsW [Microbacteriaceae bacterium]